MRARTAAGGCGTCGGWTLPPRPCMRCCTAHCCCAGPGVVLGPEVLLRGQLLRRQTVPMALAPALWGPALCSSSALCCQRRMRPQLLLPLRQPRGSRLQLRRQQQAGQAVTVR
jgi:hypothetical protein